MTITREAIEAFALAFWPVNAVSKMESCSGDIAKALEAALPFLSIAVEGKVEAKVGVLVWRKPLLSNSLSRTNSIAGAYRVWTHHEANGQWFWQLEDGEEHVVGSEAEGKAAAQADYERRILSALTSSPGKDGGQEVEALDAYNRSKGDTHCQTCDGTGNEGLHSICRDCDESVGAHPEMEAVAYRYRCTDIDGNPIGGWLYSVDAGSLGLREPLYTRPQPASTALVERLTKALDGLNVQYGAPDGISINEATRAAAKGIIRFALSANEDVELLHGMGSDAEFLRDLADRLRSIPVMHGTTGFDIDALHDLARRLSPVASRSTSMEGER